MSTLSHIGQCGSSPSRYKRPNSYYYVFLSDSATLAVRRVNKTHSEDLPYPFGQRTPWCYPEVPNDGFQLCFVPDSESAKKFQVDPMTNRSDPPNEYQTNTSQSLVLTRLSRSTGPTIQPREMHYM